MRGRLFTGLVSALGLLAAPAPAAADLIVIPPQFATVEAPGAETASLGATIERFQQVYGTSLLTGLNVGDQITGLTYRLDGGATALPAQTVPIYEIRLSRSNNAPGALSPVFANNRGPDEITVRTGPLVINAGDWPAVGVPRPFGTIIPFSTPYTYTGGPLLLEVAHNGFPLGGRNVDAAVQATIDAQAGFGSGFAATTADLSVARVGIVVQLQFTPAGAVPEPSSYFLFGLGALGFVGYRWRQRRRAR